MRVLALTALVLLAGCMEEIGPFSGEGVDCSPVIAQEVNRQVEVLYPAAAAEAPSPASNPRITIHARAGQMVTAQAIWSASGPVAVAYDGPAGNATTSVGTPNVWQTVVYSAPEGNVTLGLDGNPIAFGVSYTLQLTATGCTRVA